MPKLHRRALQAMTDASDYYCLGDMQMEWCRDQLGQSEPHIVRYVDVAGNVMPVEVTSSALHAEMSRQLAQSCRGRALNKLRKFLSPNSPIISKISKEFD